MATVTRRQIYSLKPLRVQVPCAFCGSLTWWARRPELVYRGSHRYGRWCCESCGRTSEHSQSYAAAKRTTEAALLSGPGTPAWRAYQALSTYL